MSLSIAFDNSYSRLGETFFARLPPVPVKAPALVALNAPLARELGISPDELRAPAGQAVLAGNSRAPGSEPLAQVYAGHQFGNIVPQLGDGRALLLGEVIDAFGQRRDIQLKGSGPTPFSRMGDGRAWLGPVLREYILSEAMHALGVPSTRALAVVTTGETVQREKPYPGAVLTRVASSHIRVGTFQYFALKRDVAALRTLCDHVIARHYPHAKDALGLLGEVVARQAELIARWMAVGFVHGVMNTDNCHIAGETIDYGPCAFLDRYDPAAVFSAIDQSGRYAYQNQPDIAVWNLAQLASSLLPLIDQDQARAVARATEVVHEFAPLFAGAWLTIFRAKLGLTRAEEQDGILISGLLDRMAAGHADFTTTFRALGSGRERDCFNDPGAWDSWAPRWQARCARESTPPAERQALRKNTNPAVIPRNHRVEEVIVAALADDFTPFERLNRVLSRPFEVQPDDKYLTTPPRPDQLVHQTFCGT
ncbi:MAG: YdiU family protein [Halocynthiibacter sp.]